MANIAAEVLRDARAQARCVAELPEGARPACLDDAYRIQDALVDLSGDRVVGWKVAGTNAQAQERLGLEEPFAGRVLARSTYESPARIKPELCFLRAVQAEFAVRLKHDLTPADLSIEGVAAAVGEVIPAVEIADTRYSDWTKVSTWHLIADNAKDGQIVFGHPFGEIGDLAAAHVRLIVNGQERARGTGAEVLGHPLNAVLWLAKDRLRRGGMVRAGEIVSTGTCTGTVYCNAGDSVVAVFQDAVNVSVEFLA